MVICGSRSRGDRPPPPRGTLHRAITRSSVRRGGSPRVVVGRLRLGHRRAVGLRAVRPTTCVAESATRRRRGCGLRPTSRQRSRRRRSSDSPWEAFGNSTGRQHRRDKQDPATVRVARAASSSGDEGDVHFFGTFVLPHAAWKHSGPLGYDDRQQRRSEAMLGGALSFRLTERPMAPCSA